MNKILLNSFFVCLVGLFGTALSAQSTFSEVLTIFEDNGCSSTYCHGGGAGGLVLDADNASQTYANLMGISPENMTALEKGDQLVTAGYPERSFLYRKINDHLYADSEMDTAMEGDMMPPGGGMSNVDKEHIRQWILYGAPETGKAFSNSVKESFTEYHEDGGIGPINTPPPSPQDEGKEGFQIYFGSIFLEPGGEIEYLKKYDLRLEEDIEVNRLELVMNDFSHHFILYKYDEQGASQVDEGLREEGELFASALLGGNSEMITAWQDNQDFRLPEGTAYTWEAGTVLDLNYHILNYDQAAPLSADMYLNVYTQPTGTAVKEMHSELMIYQNVLALWPDIPVTYSESEDWNQTINIWNMSTHTHQYGTDYDIYYQNPDGSQGIQLVEGHYNSDYTAYAGFYDYAHPPIRFFDNFLEITPDAGLIQEASYLNTGSGFVGWGLTTDDEMMLSLLQYTIGENHQEDMTLNNIASSYCLSHEPVDLIANFNSGVVGNGVVHNIFDPSVAGIGSHVLYADCCDPTKMTEIIIEVVPDLDGSLETSSVVNDEELVDLTATWSGLEEVEYQWFLEGVIIEGATSPNFTAEMNGMYSVEVGSGACKAVIEIEVTEIEDPEIIDTTDTVIDTTGTVIDTTGTVIDTTVSSIANINIAGLSANPNPFSHQARIGFVLTETSDVVAEVYDLSGRKVAVLADTQLGVGEHSYKFAGEEAGIYLIRLQVNDQVYTHKLVKQ